MIKELKTLHSMEPACQQRSDSDHLRFVICRRRGESKFDFTIELDGIRAWVVPNVPSMNPLDYRHAAEDKLEIANITEMTSEKLGKDMLSAWDRGNYIPIDDDGYILNEDEALKCLHHGALKFFLQGKKLVGEFVLLRKEENEWLLMKRHDEFALYNEYSHELFGE